MLTLYKWFAGSQNDFTRQFQNNEQLFNQARSFWNKLDGAMLIVLIVTLLIGLCIAYYYYTSYNNAPGRHYKPIKWVYFLIVTFLSTLLISFGLEYMMCEPKLNGASTLEFMVATVNALYACAIYFITSVIWCNFFPTNAYRIFKF